MESQQNYRKQLNLTGWKTFHFAVSVLLFFAAWAVFRYGRVDHPSLLRYRYNFFVWAAYAVLLLFFLRTYNGYLLGYSRIRTLIISQFISQLFAVGLIYLAVSIGWSIWYSPWPFLPLLAAQALLDVVWSRFGTRHYLRLYPPRKTLLIYRNERDRRRFSAIAGLPSRRLYHIAGELRYEGNSFSEIRQEVEKYEALFVAGLDSRCRNGIAKYCQEREIPGFFLPHVGDVIIRGAEHIQSFDSPVLYINRKQLRPEYRIVKRLLDIVFSLAGIAVLSPLLLVTALAIRLQDGGPAIYRQTRLTRNGRQFQIYKFRSMRVDAEKDGVARLSSGDGDPRVTPIGRVVRRFRLDELPQLFNILKGDMSFVGPRPERPEIAEQYYRTMPDFRLRLQVKAGLTGYAQVYGRYNTDPYEKLEFDLLYINHMNLLTDIQLLCATVSTFYAPNSTEGVGENHVTAADE